MDTGSAVVVLLIVVWGALEYRRREQNHTEVLSSLEQGRWSGPQTSVLPASKLVGEALVAILLAATSALMFQAARRGVSPRLLLDAMGVLFAAMTAVVGGMLLRDSRRRWQRPSDSGPEEP